MRSYVGLFRSDRSGGWTVSFPDLPGCTAEGTDFRSALDHAAEQLASHLAGMDRPPRPRSAMELTLDAAGDPALARSFVNAVMHTVVPLERPDVAPMAVRRGSTPVPAMHA